MKNCWKRSPANRPSFQELVETFDSMLEELTRNVRECNIIFKLFFCIKGMDIFSELFDVFRNIHGRLKQLIKNNTED